MNTPRTRAEFERNFNLLIRKMKDGKYHVPMDFPLDSFARLRFLPNGRMDFLSVDETARLQANMMNQFNEESLQEEFREYQTPVDGSSEPGDDGERSAASDGPSNSAV